MKFAGRRYDFEAEVLVRSAWAGLKLKEIPINVFYPPEKERVSGFRPLMDNLSISLMHTRLIMRRLMPIPYPKLVILPGHYTAKDILRHPVKFLRKLLAENANPLGLAVSAAAGVFLGVLPIVSLHIVSTIYVTERLHLNKIMALAVQNICMPPFVPIACIELGHFMLYGKWFTDVSWQAVFGVIPQRLWEWFLGSLILAPLLAAITGVIVYLSARHLKAKELRHADV
jgi:uncharacterized protein (DUF2062 family)